MNKTENKKKEDILKKAKKIVSIEGWSSEILSKLQKIPKGKRKFHYRWNQQSYDVKKRIRRIG